MISKYFEENLKGVFGSFVISCDKGEVYCLFLYEYTHYIDLCLLSII